MDERYDGSMCLWCVAYDAKERQHWVNRLRATAEYHSELSVNNVSFPSLWLLQLTVSSLLPLVTGICVLHFLASNLVPYCQKCVSCKKSLSQAYVVVTNPVT